jgi:hypothetical protein
MDRAARSAALVAATSVTACVSFLLAYFGRMEVAPAVPAAPVFALLLLASRPLLDRVARPVLGSRTPLVTSLALAALAPIIVLGALDALGEPVLNSGRFSCGTMRVMLEMEVPLAILVVGAAAAIGALAVGRRARARVDRGVRWLALGLAAASAVLVAAAMVRVARFPGAEGYARTLPVVARVRAISGAPTRVSIPKDSDVANPGPADLYDDEVEGVILRRVCVEHRCGATLVPLGTPTSKITLDHWNVDEDGTVLVRRDAARALWIVEGRGLQPFLGADLYRADVRVRDVADVVSPPPGWIVGAALGLAFAGLVTARRRRVAGLLGAIVGGRPGFLEASGLVTLLDGDHPLRAASGQALAVGPVVVLPGPVAPGGVYRGDGPLLGARVLCGTREEVLEEIHDRLAGLDAFVVATLALAGAPLLASALTGIVF